MAQAIPGFDADAFRTGIHAAMRMGLPVDEEQWPRFVMPVSTPVEIGQDANGLPWDPDADFVMPTPVTHRPLCALKWFTSETQAHLGKVEPAIVDITMLDAEWELVEGFDYVEIWPALADSPVRFRYSRILSRDALDTVGVWQFRVTTEDSL